MVLDLLPHGLGMRAGIADRDRELDRELAQEGDVLVGGPCGVELREHDDSQRLPRAAERQRQHPLDHVPRAPTPLLGKILRLRHRGMKRRLLLRGRNPRDPLPTRETRAPSHHGRIAEGPGIEHLGPGIQDPEREFGEGARPEEEIARAARKLVALQERELAGSPNEGLESLFLARGALGERGALVHRVRRFTRLPASGGLWISARNARSSLGPRWSADQSALKIRSPRRAKRG